MKESQLAEELQAASNIDKIAKAVAKVKRQREVENSNELNFDSLGYKGDSYE